MDEKLAQHMILTRRPIVWDPLPPWIRLTPEKLADFTRVQQQYITKITEIEQEKIQKLADIAGIKLG